MKMLNIKHISLSVYFFILLFVCSCGKKDETLYTVKGTLQNLESPFIFITTEKNDSILLDTIFVDKKGHFSYKGKADQLTMVSLYFEKKSWSTSVFVDKGWNVEVKGDINHPDLININGGDVNNDLTAFKKDNLQLFNTRSELLSQIENATTPEMKQNYSTELKNVNFELTNKAREFVQNNPDKIASVILIQDFYKNSTSVDALDEELKLLKGDAARFFLTKDLQKFSEKVKSSQIGAKAPSFELKNKDKEINLDDFKNKYLLITFSTDNEDDSVMESLPIIMDTYKKLKGKNVEFLSVVFNDEVLPVADSIKWTVFYDTKGWASEIIKSYNINELPYSVLISPEGLILERGLSVVPSIDKIDELLQANKAK